MSEGRVQRGEVEHLRAVIKDLGGQRVLISVAVRGLAKAAKVSERRARYVARTALDRGAVRLDGMGYFALPAAVDESTGQASDAMTAW